MAAYGINQAGLEGLRQLAKDMSTLNDAITDAGKDLKSTISSYGEDLGIYEDKILELVDSVNTTQESGRESVELLIEEVKNLGDKIEELIAKGLVS